MKRSQLSVILSMFAVFCSGIAVGAYGITLIVRKRLRRLVSRPSRPRSGGRNTLKRYGRAFAWTSSQVVSLNSILDETRSRFRSLKDRQKQEQKNETDRIRSEQNEKVRAMLKPEQRPEYDSFREERERRMKEQAAKNEAEKKQQNGK